MLLPALEAIVKVIGMGLGLEELRFHVGAWRWVGAVRSFPVDCDDHDERFKRRRAAGRETLLGKPPSVAWRQEAVTWGVSHTAEVCAVDARLPRRMRGRVSQRMVGTVGAPIPNLISGGEHKYGEELEVTYRLGMLLSGGEHDCVGKALPSPAVDGPVDDGWKAERRSPKEPLVLPGDRR